MITLEMGSSLAPRPSDVLDVALVVSIHSNRAFFLERDFSPSKRGLIHSMQGLAGTDISLEFQLQGFLQQAGGLGWC